MLTLDGCSRDCTQAPELAAMLQRLNIADAWSLRAAAEIAQELIQLPRTSAWAYAAGVLVAHEVEGRVRAERPAIAPFLPAVEDGRLVFGWGRTRVTLELAPAGIRVSSGFIEGAMTARQFLDHPRGPRAFGRDPR
jgi:hypothetical protein